MHRAALLALPLSLLATPAAFALSTDRAFDLSIEGTPVGTMTMRARVFDDGNGRCQYTGRWSSLRVGLTRTRLCSLAEYKASDNFDCEENRRSFFPTVLTVPQNVAGACAGFDEWGQATDIPRLLAGENPSGDIYGIIVTESIGDVQSFGMTVQRPSPIVQAGQRTLQPKLPIAKAPILVIP